MNASLKWKLGVGFALVFIAGLAAGAFLGAAQSRHPRPDFGRHRFLADRLRSRMETGLKLTPEQISRTAPIFDKTARELEDIRADTGRRVHEVMIQADRALAPELTPEQRAKLKTLATHRDPNRDDRKVSRGGPGDPTP